MGVDVDQMMACGGGRQESDLAADAYYIRCETTPPLQVARSKLVSVVGSQSPSDIASGRIAEMRKEICHALHDAHSQQECRGILGI